MLLLLKVCRGVLADIEEKCSVSYLHAEFDMEKEKHKSLVFS